MSSPVNVQDPQTTVERLSQALGARVDGLDLSRELTEAEWSSVRSAFREHALVLVRDQDVTVDEQRRYARGFSELGLGRDEDPLETREHTAMFALDGHPDCLPLHNNAERRPGLDHWHMDNVGFAEPPSHTVLYAKVIPALGGDTIFANLHLAYEALSPTMQEFLSGLHGVNSMRQAFKTPMLDRALRARGIDPEEHFERHPPVEHPLVRTHPLTGRKALFFSVPHTTHIAGLGDAESKALLGFLAEHVQNPAFQYRHRWQEGDLLVWDNRCLQHLPLADYYPHERLMFRMSVSGDRPC